MTVKGNNTVNPLDKEWRVIFFSQLKFSRKTSRPVEAFIYFEQ